MVKLTALQIRVIGVMLEKEITTPEHYPLSLNALTNACNQKSNREPVLSLSESDVQDLVDQLIDNKQLMIDTLSSGRVNKYKHRFCNTTFGDLQFTAQQTAIICLLFLRGPQTPGELRTRSTRLADFANVNEVEAVLEQLQHLNNTVLVEKLAREPGKRESRYAHLFCDTPHSAPEATNDLPSTQKSPLETRVTELEQQVSELQTELARLSALIA